MYRSDAVILNDFADQFDQHACALLDKCNTAADAERLLLAPFMSEKLARGKLPVLDFALRHSVREFVSHRWVQMYATELWYSADVHFVPTCSETHSLSSAEAAFDLYINPIRAGQDNSYGFVARQYGKHEKTWMGALVALPLLCLGTLLAAVRVVSLSLTGLAGVWTAVLICCALGTLTAVQLGLWTGWSWLFFALLACWAGSAVWEYHGPQRPGVADYRVNAHNKSRFIFVKVSLAWNSPFIKFSLFSVLYIAFVLIVTDLALADRHYVKWSEVAVYVFGAGLLLAEVTQIKHNKPVGSSCWADLQHYLSGWNMLDVSIVCLIGVCACQRLPLIVVRGCETQVNGTSSTEAVLPDLSCLWVDDVAAGQSFITNSAFTISVLCIAVWLRLLGLMVISPDLGPLILMVKEMRTDLRRFMFLCAAFVLGFGASISALVLDDHGSSIDSIYDALHSTLQGIIGTQDMEPVTTSWEVELVYTVYLVLAQVLLLNLLIAMFSSTYERIKENEIDEWRVARAQIILEYSHAVRGVFELPLLNLLSLAFLPLVWLRDLLRRLKCSRGRVTHWSRVRVPWEGVQLPLRFEKVAQTSDYAPEVRANEYVGTEDGRMGVVEGVDGDDVWLQRVCGDTGGLLPLTCIRKEQVVVTWHPKEGDAALAARGWQVDWTLPLPLQDVRTYGYDAEFDHITRRRALFCSLSDHMPVQRDAEPGLSLSLSVPPPLSYSYTLVMPSQKKLTNRRCRRDGFMLQRTENPLTLVRWITERRAAPTN